MMKTLKVAVRSILWGGLLLASIAHAAPVSPVDAVRTAAGTAQIPRLNLELTSAEQATLDAVPFRFFSSVEVKRRLHPVIMSLQLDERLGSPLLFDPGRSAYDHRMALRRYRNNTCDRTLQSMSVTAPGKTLKGDAALLVELEGISNRLLKANGDAARSAIPKAISDKLIAKVKAQIAVASSTMKVQNPMSSFGDVVAVDGFGGEHFRIKFKNLKAEVSLPMVLSFITGKDAAFIRTMECAANRLVVLNKDPETNRRIFHFMPGRLSQTLKAKVQEALQANRMMAKLNYQQLLVIADTLMQMGAKGIMSPETFANKQKQMIAATTSSKNAAAVQQGIAEIEFLQFQQREISDFRDWLTSTRLMKAQARVN